MTLKKKRSLFLEERVNRTLPVNLNSQDNDVFIVDEERVFSEVFLLEGKASLAPEGILFDGLSIIDESLPELCRGWKRRGLKSKLKSSLKNLFHQLTIPKVESSPSLWVTDLWSSAYYHWWVEACTRLISVQKDWSNLTLYLPTQFQAIPFIGESLHLLRFRKVKYVSEVTTCEYLTFPEMQGTSGHVRPEMIQRLREILNNCDNASNVEPMPRIYISREKASKRKVINEEALRPILEKHDISIVFMEDYSLEDQIGLMQHCDFLMGCHGAGLTNMLFLPNHAVVMELRRKEGTLNTFFNLASACELKYTYFFGEACYHSRDWNIDDIAIDVDMLDQQLSEVLANHVD